MLAGCFLLQNIYGKQPENILAINQLFHSLLGKYQSSQVIRAFELWLERSQEFPTPADIIGIIKRKGKPPLKESDIIAIRRKDGADRTRDEWALLREWEQQQAAGWSDFEDDAQAEATAQENITLRQQVKSLTAEVTRLTDLLHQTRVAKGLEAVKPSLAHKVAATVEAMRAGGASDEDIATFEASQGAVA